MIRSYRPGLICQVKITQNTIVVIYWHCNSWDERYKLFIDFSCLDLSLSVCKKRLASMLDAELHYKCYSSLTGIIACFTCKQFLFLMLILGEVKGQIFPAGSCKGLGQMALQDHARGQDRWPCRIMQGARIDGPAGLDLTISETPNPLLEIVLKMINQ